MKKTISNPFTPPKPEDEPCTIIFGHNVKINKVLMQFQGGIDRLILSPEAARDVAEKLMHFADLADGKKDA